MSLPIKSELTLENPTSPEFQFTGTVCIVISGGIGEVVIERSVSGSSFMPLTDTAGNVVTYEVNGDVALNADLENKSSSVTYRLSGGSIEAPITFMICR